MLTHNLSLSGRAGDEGGGFDHRKADDAAGRGQTGMSRIRKLFVKTPGEVSWVGECRWTNTRCFGCEDGRLLIESPGSPEVGDGKMVSMVLAPTISFPIATDTINDVAFAGDLFAASSRNEVVLGRRLGPGIAELGHYDHPFIGGAHGVVASRSGAFLAPIADQGLLILKITDHQGEARIGSPPGAPFNFYRLARLGSGPENEAFAAAGRRDGLMAFAFTQGSPSSQMIHHRFEGHDIVDVCPLNDPSFPLAAACVSRDRVIFLMRNVLEEQKPSTLNLASLEGTAYTLLSAQGHLFLLTDRELIVMPGMASQFLRGQALGPELAMRIIPVDAAEAFMMREESILLIEEDSIVSKLEISEMVGTRMEEPAHAGSMWNGWAHQGSFVEVPCDPKQVSVTPIESGWQPGAEGVLVTSPAA
jgi:hypothetical protein